MRIRQTKERIKAPDIKELEDKISEAAYNSVTYKLKVITPIYGGGVKAGEPDMEMPIRASAIRGQLRYWWRFLKMNDPVEENRLEREELFKEERRIWGGMTDAPDEDGSSKVFIRVKCEPIERSNLIKASEKIGRNNGIGYALFSAVQGRDDDLIKEGIEFEVFISSGGLNENDRKLVLESFYWWSCFGGIGARTRRGLGSVEVLSSTDKSYKLLTKESVEKVNGCKLEQINTPNAINAWNKSVGRLQEFRQGADEGREHKSNSDGTKKYYNGNRNSPELGQSFWPEADSIRNTTGKKGHPIKHKDAINSFPRAAFGLPIIFDFNVRPSKCEPPKTELNCENSERMGSPLILKAMATENGYNAIALLMPHQHVDTMSVTLDYSAFDDYKKKALEEVDRNRQLNPNEKRNKKDKLRQHHSELEKKLPKSFISNWWNESKAKDVKPINDNKGDNNATNALDAFMNFFAKGGKD